MNRAEAQQLLTEFEMKYPLWSNAYNLAHTMINAFNKNSRNIKDAQIKTYLTTNGKEVYTKTSTAIQFFQVEINQFRSTSHEECDKYAILIRDRFKHFNSFYPSMFTDYLKRAIASCDAHFTDVDIQSEIQELEKFIQSLPKELLLEDLLPAVNQVKDKISAYQQAGDKDKHIQQLNKKLTDEHSILTEQSRILKDEIVQNEKLLKELGVQTKSAEQSLSALRIEESRLKALLVQLDADRAQLQKEIEALQKENAALQKEKSALQKETGGLQLEADLVKSNKAIVFEQGQVVFILDRFSKDIKKIDTPKHDKAKEVALALHTTLNEHAQLYFKDHNKEAFIASCRSSIDAVKPELNELGWGRKLQNLLIALWNAIMPQSLQSNFFKTKLTEKAETVLEDLQNVDRNAITLIA